MKLFTGWVLAVGLVLAATGAHAQMVAPNEAGRPLYRSVSDVSSPVGGPYAAMPSEAPRPGYGPTLLPSTEVYTVVREAGLSPLGIPHLRGFIYTIAVIDRSGNDGRLFIDARNGRVIRFASAQGIGNAIGNAMGDNFNEDPAVIYGAPGTLPPPTNVRGAPRPPRTIPHVASRTVPVPKASPLAGKPVTEPAAKPAPEQAQQTPPPPQTPPQQAAATTPKPTDAQTLPPAAATTGEAQAKPLPQIAPTQDMPKMQGLE
jgi:hypothetical protein